MRVQSPRLFNGSWADAHDLARAELEPVFVPVTPYAIPYRSLTPKGKECENLLVSVCVSASHVAYGSIRMEPVYMILGQACGVAAAIAVDDEVSVQRIDVGKRRHGAEAAILERADRHRTGRAQW